MFSFNRLKTVQIEITNRCQASCPMCLRNIHGGIDNPSLQPADWSLQLFKDTFNDTALSQIERIIFCGDFGDPIINSDLIEMCRYVRDNKPNVFIQISTNASAHNDSWWKSLAEALPLNHLVTFAIDGLNDTHALYRIGTRYEHIIRNAKSFIGNGGKAEWMFIRFKHNEHQVEEARAISEDIGFINFSTKDSKRFGKKYPVLNKNGIIEYYLEPPSNSTIKPVEFLDLKDYKQWKTDVDCFAFETKELYIDASGYVMPCCLIGSFLYANYDVELYKKYGVNDETSITGIARELQLEVLTIIEELGGLDALDIRKHTIEDIMSSEVWQTLMHKKWEEKSSSVCKILCGVNGPFIKISEQLNK